MAEEQVLAGDKSQCSFVSLPAELRNHIYELALSRRKTVRLGSFVALSSGPWLLVGPPKSTPPIHWPYLQLKEPGLLAVNRQVRKEALAIYYGNRSFALDLCNEDSYLGPISFMLQLGPERIAMLRSVYAVPERYCFNFRPESFRLREEILGILDQIVKAAGNGCLRKDALLLPRANDGRSAWERVTECGWLKVVDVDGGWTLTLA